jgi:hypothetical protein
MKIGTIVKSNSHVDYAGQVISKLEVGEQDTPKADDYTFAQFVKIPNNSVETIGVIYNSLLINPEFGNFGPRLTNPSEANRIFSPDYINEQGILIGILLLGWRNDGQGHQRIPRVVLPPDSPIEKMSDEEMHAFHRDGNGQLQMHYVPHVITHAGQLARQLLLTIIEQLISIAPAEDHARLRVLERTLIWQQTIEQF